MAAPIPASEAGLTNLAERLKEQNSKVDKLVSQGEAQISAQEDAARIAAEAAREAARAADDKGDGPEVAVKVEMEEAPGLFKKLKLGGLAMSFLGTAMTGLTTAFTWLGNALGPNVQDDMVVEADGFVSFDESGFTLGSNTGTSDTYHNTGDKYVAFTWKAGGSKGTWNIDGTSFASASAAGLDGGTIDPTYASVGTKQGFGIYKYTGNGTSGADIVHGLSQAPDLIIAKNLGENSTQWLTSHRSAGLTGDNISGTSVPEWYELYLNAETARANNSTDVAAPDGATKITLGSGDNINKNTISYIMLAWHNVTGVQKFGTYIGSGAVSNPFTDVTDAVSNTQLTLPTNREE